MVVLFFLSLGVTIILTGIILHNQRGNSQANLLSSVPDFPLFSRPTFTEKYFRLVPSGSGMEVLVCILGTHDSV